ncbi:MAG: NAD(P)/FAD-dependent oxidoreductase, partial [Acidobacteria bacterium]|nr:NAD(P)/FAD-dependent oxidoreductase [Acidobacteriota bacterium]
EKLAWEKPCGGGVTFKAYEQYPFVKDAPHRPVVHSIITTENAGGVALDLNKPLLIFARKDLNQLLLDRASRAGARIEKARVTEARPGGAWSLATSAGGKIEADFVVVATGARNPLRSLGTQFHPGDTMTALGYYTPGARPDIDIQFFPGFEGYIWNFPRCDHASVGICGKRESAHAMRARLEAYMESNGIPRGQFYAHVLPSLETPSWRENRVAGNGWLAVGDSAGLVDPVTGEGIYYAMRSGELAGSLIAQGQVHQYKQAIAAEFADDLAYASTLAHRVFTGRYFFSANTRRLNKFLRHSPRLRGIVQELFAGTLPYVELRRRIKSTLHATLAEIAVNGFLRRVVQ